MKTPLYLLKDIVIPAGTKFEEAPLETSRCHEGHVSHIIGLSKDSSGDLVYFAGAPGSPEREQLKEWFSEEPFLGGCPPDCHTQPDPVPPSELETIAGELYSAYCEAVGGVAFNGDPLPDWPEFAADPNKEKQSNAWVAAASKAIEILER